MESCCYCIFWFAQLLNQSRHLTNRGNKQNVYSIFFHGSNCQYIPNIPEATIIWLPTNIVFSIYDSAMHLSCYSSSDICLYGWTDGGRILKRVLAIEKMLAWLSIPLTLLLSLYILPWRTQVHICHMWLSHLQCYTVTHTHSYTI